MPRRTLASKGQRPTALTQEELNRLRQDSARREAEDRVLRWLRDSCVLESQVRFGRERGHRIGRRTSDLFHGHPIVIQSGARRGQLFGFLCHGHEYDNQRTNNPNNFNIWTQWHSTGEHSTDYIPDPPREPAPAYDPPRSGLTCVELEQHLRGDGVGLDHDEHLCQLSQVDYEVLPRGQTAGENEWTKPVTLASGRRITVVFGRQDQIRLHRGYPAIY